MKCGEKRKTAAEPRMGFNQHLTTNTFHQIQFHARSITSGIFPECDLFMMLLLIFYVLDEFVFISKRIGKSTISILPAGRTANVQHEECRFPSAGRPASPRNV
jgi:hypothetical protein